MPRGNDEWLAGELERHCGNSGGVRLDVYVEGRFDEAVLRQHLSRRYPALGVWPADGKLGVIDKAINQRGLGVVDDDYARFLGSEKLPRNVLRTDQNDLECTVLASEAEDGGRVLAQLVDLFLPQRVQTALQNRERLDVVALLLGAAGQIGRWRYANHRTGFGVNFKGLHNTIHHIFSPHRFEVDPDALKRTLLDLNPGQQGAEQVTSLEHAVMVQGGGLPLTGFELCHGKDLLAVLGFLLDREGAPCPGGMGEIERTLRATFTSRVFFSTELGRKLDERIKRALRGKGPSRRDPAG